MHTSVFRIKSVLLGSTLLAGSFFPAAYAQEADPTAPDQEIVYEPIVVTSNKRAESIQTIGLSVSAISGDDLQAQGAADFDDYAITIPNLAFAATDDGILANRTISIRGIEGLNTTGFYIDDVPLDESIDPLVLDVERVEVLRGPQGTLYGARGLGGTVRIITKKPDFDVQESRVHAGLSFTEEGGANYVLDGATNIPLSDNAAIRLLGYYAFDEGIFDLNVGPASAPGQPGAAGAPGVLVGDPATQRENVDDKTTYGGQVAFLWEPTNNFSVTAKALAQKTEIDGFPLSDFTFDAAAPPAQITLAADDLVQNRLFDVREFGEDEWFQLSLTGAYETSFGTFTSSTGYFDRETLEGEDSSEFISFTLLGPILQSAGLPTVPTAVPSPIFQTLEFQTFAQEFRFVSDFEGPFQMTTGLFYQETDDDEAFIPENIATGFDTAFSTQVTGGALTSGATGTGDLIFTSDRNFNVEEIGVYGEFSYDLTDRLSATLGGRYFDTETSFTETQSGFAAGGLNAVNIGPINQSEDGYNFKGLIEYEASDSVYIFASVSEGFRIGGGNGDLPAALGCPAQAQALGISPADAQTFGSDDLTSYELGAKTTWDDGRFILNGSLFHIDFSDIQQRILLTCGFSFIANIGEAQSRGFELETTLRPTDNLILQGALGYTDAEFTEDVAGVVSDGDRLQQIPEWTASASFDYTIPSFIGGFDGYMRGDFAFVGESISRVVDSGNPRIRPSYEIVNARFGVRNDSYSIGLFVDNLFDEDAVYADNRTLAAEAAGRPRIVRNRPRTIGVDLRTNF